MHCISIGPHRDEDAYAPARRPATRAEGGAARNGFVDGGGAACKCHRLPLLRRARTP